VRLAFLLSLALVAGVAQADVRARVVATDPPAEATLGRDQAFYVRIQFDADEPVGFWTRAYSRGRQLGGWKSNASAKWSGSGHALGWISFSQPVEVDEIRVVAGGGKPYREREVATYPVKLRWGEGPAADVTAPWVAELKQATSAAWEAERRAEAAERRIEASELRVEAALRREEAAAERANTLQRQVDALKAIERGILEREDRRRKQQR